MKRHLFVYMFCDLHYSVSVNLRRSKIKDLIKFIINSVYIQSFPIYDYNNNLTKQYPKLMCSELHLL